MTNDGATILKAIGVDNPAAKVLVGEFGERGGWGAVTDVYYILILYTIHAHASLAHEWGQNRHLAGPR